MKKISIVTVAVVLLLYVFSSVFAQDSTPAPDKVFTLEELANFDGAKGSTAYVAIDGIVYDVTGNRNWKNGRHKRGLRAGKDLSGMISKSPHGNSVLKKLPKVGTLKK